MSRKYLNKLRKIDAALLNKLQNGANINSCDIMGKTALIYAVREQNVMVVFTLIKEGADVNLGDKLDNTPITLVSENGNKLILQALLQKGADVNSCEIRRHSALMFASSAGNDKCVDLLLKSGAVVDQPDINRDTALMFSAIEGKYESTGLLLDAGADINAQNNKGQTALMIAAASKACPCCVLTTVRLLLQRGADPDVVCNDKLTVYHYSLMKHVEKDVRDELHKVCLVCKKWSDDPVTIEETVNNFCSKECSNIFRAVNRTQKKIEHKPKSESYEELMYGLD